MLQRFAGRRTAVFLGLLLFAMAACRDDDKLLGSEVQPDGELVPIETLDTFSILAYNSPSVSLRTDEVNNFVGQVITPQMGLTQAGFTINFGLTDSNPFFRDTEYRVDSVVLMLDPSLFWGTYPTEIPLEVFALREQIFLDDNYQSDYAPAIEFEPVGSGVVALDSEDDLNDTISIDYIDVPDSTVSAIHHIRLDNSIGEQILFGWGVEYQNESEFREYFHGLQVKVNADALAGLSPGIINYFLTSPNSGIHLYTSYDEEVTNNDSTVSIVTQRELFYFPVRSQNARFNTFSHDFSGSELADALANPSDANQPLYIQGLAGSRAEIIIPHLETFVSNNDGIVSKATLEFELADDQSDLFDPAERIFLIAVDFQDVNDDPDIEELEEIERFSLDYLYSTSRYDGELNDGKYVFDVTREMQSAIERFQAGQAISPGFRIVRELFALNDHQNVPSETVLKGAENITLKLHITPL